MKQYLDAMNVQAQKKIFRMIILVIMILSVIFIPPLLSSDDEVHATETLRMASTTSTADTGFLHVLAEKALEDLQINLEYIAVGTGEAITIAEHGDVDLILVHDPVREELFVTNGYGVERVLVMYNDFVIVGPLDVLHDTSTLQSTFQSIVNQQIPFISRGDQSGTHRMELRLWNAFEIDPADNPQYMESGQGMGVTLQMANELHAFTLTDRGTFLSQLHHSDITFELQVISQGDSLLMNQYALIVVNPKRHQEVHAVLAERFVRWMVSQEIQEWIAQFGVQEYGESLFFPNADANGTIME